MKKLRAPTSNLGEAEDSGKVRGLLSVGGRFTFHGRCIPPATAVSSHNRGFGCSSSSQNSWLSLEKAKTDPA